MDDALLRAFRDAFPAGVAPERPVTGHRCWECDEVDELLGARLWPDVADDFPNHCCDTYSFLTPAAKVYYLPAYMCYELRAPEMPAGISIQGALELGELPREAFTPAQRDVILRWAEGYYRNQPEGRPPDHVVGYWQDKDG